MFKQIKFLLLLFLTLDIVTSFNKIQVEAACPQKRKCFSYKSSSKDKDKDKDDKCDKKEKGKFSCKEKIENDKCSGTKNVKCTVLIKNEVGKTPIAIKPTMMKINCNDKVRCKEENRQRKHKPLKSSFISII